jgi:hypothetical protein
MPVEFRVVDRAPRQGRMELTHRRAKQGGSVAVAVGLADP